MKKIFCVLSLISLPALANLHLAPPDFSTKSGRVVFVDFKTAEYDITYDLANQVTTVKSRITFENTKSGKPVFDLVPKIFSARIDGVSVKTPLIELPGKASKARLVDLDIAPGEHVLEIESELTKYVSYDDEGTRVSSAFWIRDLKDRLFLEQFVPSNLEYDQYKMSISVKFTGVRKLNQEFFTNGTVTQTSPLSWKIDYPAYFTSSSLYFHTTRKGSYRRLDSVYKSIDGRNIPVTVYTMYLMQTSKFQSYTHEVLAELEKDYGPWGHPSFVAYGTLPGTGGMEHSGATQTSLAALDHELIHSYFAKGVMPANGNSGWVDEGIASWRDKGYQTHLVPQFSGSNLGGQSIYKRNTDDRCYDLGAKFMAYLDFRLQNVGGLKAFLKGYFAAYNHMVITQEHFKNNLEFFSGLDLTHEFETLIWGTNPTDEKHTHGNPKHLSMTESQLRSLL
jgi:hypothetical protein